MEVRRLRSREIAVGSQEEVQSAKTPAKRGATKSSSKSRKTTTPSNRAYGDREQPPRVYDKLALRISPKTRIECRGVFVDSLIYFSYLCVLGPWVSYFLTHCGVKTITSILPVRMFVSFFVVDFTFQSVLSQGYACDPIFPWMMALAKKRKIRDDIHHLTCLSLASYAGAISALVFVSSVQRIAFRMLFPLVWPRWARFEIFSGNIISGFLVELLLSFFYQLGVARAAIIAEAMGDRYPRISSRCLTSIGNSALIVLGSSITIGGPTLNAAYTFMAMAGHMATSSASDWHLMLILLTTANAIGGLLAGYCIGKDMPDQTVESSKEH